MTRLQRRRHYEWLCDKYEIKGMWLGGKMGFMYGASLVGILIMILDLCGVLT